MSWETCVWFQKPSTRSISASSRDTKVLLDLACRRDESFDASFAEALRRAQVRVVAGGDAR